MAGQTHLSFRCALEFDGPGLDSVTRYFTMPTDMNLIRWLRPALVVVWLFSPRLTSAEEPAELPTPPSRANTNLHGWTVRVDIRLFETNHARLAQSAIELLNAKLADITYVVAPEPLRRLRSVPIILDLNCGRLRSMQYHPSPEWLREHGYAEELAKCVHITDAADFARARQVNEQPWVVLHELAHAYHDQTLGFEHQGVERAYHAFKQSLRGEKVLLFNGEPTRHYALTDAKEFFAEFTESYFGVNDFFPFNRAELKTSEPAIYEVMRKIWGPAQRGSGQ